MCFEQEKPMKLNKGPLPRLALTFSCCWRSLGHIDDVPVGTYRDDDRIGLLAAGLIGRRREVKLTTVPFSRHQGVRLPIAYRKPWPSAAQRSTSERSI